MKIDSYSISHDPVENLVKGGAIWANHGATSFPIVYLRKPKGIKKEIFDKIIETITINVPQEIL